MLAEKENKEMEIQKKQSSKTNWWKVSFLLLVVFLITGANIFGWLFLKNKNLAEITPTPTLSPLANVKVKTEVKKISSPTPVVDESELIKEAVFKKTGLDKTKAEVTISKNAGEFASGGIKEFEAVGGAWWIAAKTDDGWICVHTGQSNPSCQDIAPYNFPTSIAPECMDENNQVVIR